MTDEQIEAVARKICVNLGVDPDAPVGGGVYDDDTPAESAARANAPVPMVMVFRPLWRFYRASAAQAIATKAALEA